LFPSISFNLWTSSTLGELVFGVEDIDDSNWEEEEGGGPFDLGGGGGGAFFVLGGTGGPFMIVIEVKR